jgi:hypothetical protein
MICARARCDRLQEACSETVKFAFSLSAMPPALVYLGGQGSPMIRSATALCLVAAAVILSGCSGGHYVNLDEYRQKRVTTAGERPTMYASHRPRPRGVATTIPTPAEPETTGSIGTVGRTRDIAPWPKRGTPEWDRLQAEEREREKRIEQVMHSICRGC